MEVHGIKLHVASEYEFKLCKYKDLFCVLGVHVIWKLQSEIAKYRVSANGFVSLLLGVTHTFLKRNVFSINNVFEESHCQDFFPFQGSNISVTPWPSGPQHKLCTHTAGDIWLPTAQWCWPAVTMPTRSFRKSVCCATPWKCLPGRCNLLFFLVFSYHYCIHAETHVCTCKAYWLLAVIFCYLSVCPSICQLCIHNTDSKRFPSRMTRELGTLDPTEKFFLWLVLN